MTFSLFGFESHNLRTMKNVLERALILNAGTQHPALFGKLGDMCLWRIEKSGHFKFEKKSFADCKT